MLNNLPHHAYQRIMNKLPIPKSFLMLTLNKTHYWDLQRKIAIKKIIRNWRIYNKNKKKYPYQPNFITHIPKHNYNYIKHSPYNADFDGDEMNVYPEFTATQENQLIQAIQAIQEIHIKHEPKTKKKEK